MNECHITDFCWGVTLLSRLIFAKIYFEIVCIDFKFISRILYIFFLLGVIKDIDLGICQNLLILMY